MTQSEQVLENELIKQLENIGYKYVKITNEDELIQNLKLQLEAHNNIKLTDGEFNRVLNHLNKGNVFEKAKILRDKMYLQLDNGEGKYIEFLQVEQWCKNEYQVTNQVTIEGTYKNRYDVTILINGMPLIQIELKRRGVELKEAFNQIERYQKHSFGANNGLYQYVQIFVISNGVNTKYFANNRSQTEKQSFYWTDKENNKISKLESFAKEFLEPCFVSKIITKYIVLNETSKMPMVMRPYQYYAVELILDRVKTTTKNGFIWHTTGSGKTLTSFKASQILIQQPKVDRVVFVVDRKDLDYQTINEFNSFSDGSVDATDNTRMLVKQFEDDKRLIVTTIQKLNNALNNAKYTAGMSKHKNERIIFIFDECHRTQFGITHKNIRDYFTKAQMFGFTGTPIFNDNSPDGILTTSKLFDECLHKYVITDAIGDENVLRFSVEYIGRYRQKEGSKTEIDIKVQDIDTQELFESEERINKITDYILANHESKTHGKKYNAMFCVSSVDILVKYYEAFNRKKEEGKHNLKIGTIFSYVANEDIKNDDGQIPEEEVEVKTSGKAYNEDAHSREKLDAFIEDYNKMFNTKYTTKDNQSFYNYYQELAKRVKNREVDILLVVNMFLTGFDARYLNTLYVDKNLRYHGLIQAFSRTNRILDDQKSQGNIVCFRNLKEKTDEAISLFSNKNAKQIILMNSYEEYVQEFNTAVEKLKLIAPTWESVDKLKDENEEYEFVIAFRDLMRINNILVTFSDNKWEDRSITEYDYSSYLSKYLDLYNKIKRKKDKVSILNDVDFELELIHKDEINVSYIIKLLAKFITTKDENEKEKQTKKIKDIMSGEPALRSKRELIEEFIAKSLSNIKDEEEIPQEFEKFWNDKQLIAFNNICQEEKITHENLSRLISNFLFTERKPLRDEVIEILEEKPTILQRKTVGERVLQKVMDFVEVYINGME